MYHLELLDMTRPSHLIPTLVLITSLSTSFTFHFLSRYHRSTLFPLQMDEILKQIPRDRRTYLYSATMTKKVAKLQRASLKDPVKVSVSSKYQTVETLMQYYLFIPLKYKVGLVLCLLHNVLELIK